MKGITKKLATLSLAGLFIGAAAAGLAGCDDTQGETDSGDITYYTVSLSNAYVVVNENGVETLHKGDLIERAWIIGAYKAGALTPVLKLNCGKELQTYQFVAYPQGRPAPEKYDKVCECAQDMALQYPAL